NPGGATPGIRVVDFADAPAGAVIRATGVARGPGGTVVALASIVTAAAASFAPQMGVVRLTGTVDYDGGFSGDGRLVTTMGAPYSPLPGDVAGDADRRVLVAGGAYTGCNPLPCEREPFVARFTPSGAADSTWSADGHVEPVATHAGELYSIALASGGG